MYGLKNYKITVLDDQGNEVTPTNVNIMTVNTQTSATVRSSELAASLTNPITSPASSVISFWGAESSYDVKIATEYGNVLVRGLTPRADKVIITRNMNKDQLFYALPDAGATKTSWTTRVALGGASYTIPADTLKEGDVVRIHATAYCIAANSTNTHLYDIGIGANALAATSALDATAGDLTSMDLYMTVRSSTTAMVTGWYTPVSGALATVVTKPYWVAEITIDTTAAIVVGLYCTCSASNAGNQVRADDFIVEVMRA